jgi:hypothetical protein
VRVLLARGNSKVTLLESETRETIVQSRPVDQGKAQLLIATQLVPLKTYILVLELSEETDNQDKKSVMEC